MKNPLMGMMSAMGGMNSGPIGMFQQIRQFAGLIGSRNPEQMARNYMKMNNIPESELQNVMRQAQEIARQMGMR